MNQNGILAKIAGSVCTMIGACCFAIGGSCGQYLFEHNNLTAEFLVPIRLFISGFILIAVYQIQMYLQKFTRTDKSLVKQNCGRMFRG